MLRREAIVPLCYVAVATCLVALYLRAPIERSGEWYLTAATALAVVGIVVGVIRHEPVRPVPWLVMAIGLAIGGLANAERSDALFAGSTRFPDLSNAIAVLAFPFVAVGIHGMTSPRRGSRDLLVGSEPVLHSIGLASLVWLAVMEPYIDMDQIPMGEDAWIWIVPGLLLLLAAAVVRRIDRESPDSRLFAILVAGLVASAVSAAWIGWQRSRGDFVGGGPAAASAMIGPLILGLAATLPCMAALPKNHDETFRVRWPQIVGLAAAALVPLSAMVLMLAVGPASRATLIVISGFTLAVVVLAIIRLWRLVDQVRDLTERRGQDRLAAMVEHSSDVVMLADERGVVSYASPGLHATLGWAPQRWAGRPLVEILVETERPAAMAQFEHLVAAGAGETVEFEATMVRLDGTPRRASVVMANLVGGEAVDGIVVTFRDITEQRDLERRLSHRAYHDQLTGLANRDLFVERMAEALGEHRHDSEAVAVLFIDLDDFKQVNDVLGHAAGDQLLMLVAERMTQAAGSNDTCSRFGGDEFAMLLTERGGPDRAIDVAERLLESFRRPVQIAGQELQVVGSVGIAMATRGITHDVLMENADAAMYEAKRAGKGQIRIFDPAMRMAATKRLEYRSELDSAVEEGQLRLVYMPFVDLRTGAVVGAEALVRWRHPQYGDISPAEFVPIAERSGLIVPIGQLVVDEAMRHASRWRSDANLFLSINISPAQAREPDFVQRMLAAAARHGVEPSRVVIEMTESGLAAAHARERDHVDQLRNQGFRVAIDDFGVGQASLSSLQRHPVDMIKIDRSFVEPLNRDAESSPFARMMLQAAQAVGVRTVAEGIETTAELTELRRMGCELGQGFLLSQPLEVDELERRFGGLSSVGAHMP